MGGNYFEKAKPNPGICEKVTSPPLNLLCYSSEQECPVLGQICAVNVKKSGKRHQYKQSTINKSGQIPRSKVYTCLAVAKRHKCRDIDDEIKESDEITSTLYRLDKTSGTNTVLESPKERGDCAAVETQTIKLIEKRCILSRISFPKLGCLCCYSGCYDRPPSIHNADSFESIDITTPQSHKISTFDSAVCNIVRHNNILSTAKRIKFNVKVAQILNKVTLQKFRKTSKELLKSFKTFSYECNV